MTRHSKVVAGIVWVDLVDQPVEERENGKKKEQRKEQQLRLSSDDVIGERERAVCSKQFP